MSKTMKRARCLLAFLAAAVLAFALAGTALAAEDPSITIKATSTTGEAAIDSTAYTWHQIMEADIEESPTQDGATQSDGKVAYYVTTQDRATQLENTGLFNVARVGTTDKWYVELKDPETPASSIEAAFKADTFDLSKFPSGGFAQTTVAGEATSGPVPAGYYFISSTAGTNAVIQTLAAVTIDEKNTFPRVTKTVNSNDANAEIGNDITFTMTVQIPTTANDKIALTDTMTDGLTFKSIKSVKSDAEGTPDVAYTTNPNPITPAAVTGNHNTFTITFTAETVKANQGKTITITYTAVLNNKAVIGTPDNKNTVVLDYGAHYTSKPKVAATTTYSFDFDKVDGADESKKKLTGAKFKLTRTNDIEGDPIDLIEVEAGKTYRIAMSEDTGTPVKEITTNGNTVTINGLDTDVTYYLVETEAPTSYNKLAKPIEVKATDNAFAHQDIKNNKGSVLPSTGGIGTTILYIIGGILIVGAVVFLVTRRRAAKTEESDFKSDDLS